MKEKWKIGPNRWAELKQFRGQQAAREEMESREIVLAVNEKPGSWAARLYPTRQNLILKSIQAQSTDCKTFWFGPDESRGTADLAEFYPGQYVALTAMIGGRPITRPFGMISSPGQAREGLYGFTIRAQGLLSNYMVREAMVGDRFTASAPGGSFYWQPMRDSGHLIALASGSGVVDYLSMAQAIREGSLNLQLTILYTCPWQEGFLHKQELDELCGAGVKVEYFSPDCPDGSLQPLTAADVQRAAGNDEYSVFYCGSPNAVAEFKKMTAGLKPAPRSVRSCEAGVFCAPAPGDEYTLTVHARSVTYTIAAKPGEVLITALERAGIQAPVRCRGGYCGFCRSRWVSGDYEVMPDMEHRSEMEQEFGWIHPCCTVPLSDMEMEIFPV